MHLTKRITYHYQSDSVMHTLYVNCIIHGYLKWSDTNKLYKFWRAISKTNLYSNIC